MRLIPPHLLLAAVLSISACAVEGLEEEEAGLEETEQWAVNQWAVNGFMLNSLVGTDEALYQLRTHELATDTFDPDIGELPYALNYGPSRSFLKYLAGCALAPESAPITFDDVDGNHHVFTGNLGLCPEWETDLGGPSDECLELVSACMFGLNNGKGKSVMVSLRGADLDDVALPTASRMAGKTTDIGGKPVASYNSCSGTLSGAARDCGWNSSKSFIGSCTTGQEVKLNCAATGPTFNMVARIVNGIEGRNHSSKNVLAEGTVCDAQTPSISFKCGSDGGFVAMTGPVTSGVKYYGSFSNATGGKFPDTELGIFKVREGGFWGNMFKDYMLNSLVSVTTDASGDTTIDLLATVPANNPQHVFQDAWACHDVGWTDGLGYMTNRLCALVFDDDPVPDSAVLCAAKSLGPCQGGAPPQCASGDGWPVVGDWDFDGCLDPGLNLRQYPITTMVHKPCDLVQPGMEHLCERIPIIQ